MQGGNNPASTLPPISSSSDEYKHGYVMPMAAEEEGVDGEEEEVVAVALFKPGAGGPLMDKSSPQMVDKVPGVAEASRKGGGGREEC